MESILFIILLLSILFQITSAVYSLYLIKFTGLKYSWFFLATALLLMSIRRAIVLYYVLTYSNYFYSTTNEVLGLLLSIFMLIAIRGIGKILVERKTTEEKINSLLQEKDLVLKEVHHRIKNNMNTTYGLIVLQAESLTDKEARKALDNTASRVQAMITLYEELFISGHYNEVSMKKYLPLLAERIISNFPNRDIVNLTVTSDEFTLDEKKLSSLGLIVNELLTNIMKYAFVGRKSGEIIMILKNNSGGFLLTIEDNGAGLPDDSELAKQSGFGLSLVNSLTKQLNGKISFESNNGTKVILEFDAN